MIEKLAVGALMVAFVGAVMAAAAAAIGGVFYVFWNLLLHDAANLPIDRLPYWWQCVVFGWALSAVFGWFGKSAVSAGK